MPFFGPYFGISGGAGPAPSPPSAPNSRSAAIAVAYARWLNDPARGWPAVGSLPWLAQMTWQPKNKLKDLVDGLHVQVVPVSLDPEELANRGLALKDYTILLGIRQRFTDGGPIPDAWVNDRVYLTEQIANATFDLVLANEPTNFEAWAHQVTVEALADYSALMDFRTYVGVLMVAFRESSPR